MTFEELKFNMRVRCTSPDYKENKMGTVDFFTKSLALVKFDEDMQQHNGYTSVTICLIKDLIPV